MSGKEIIIDEIMTKTVVTVDMDTSLKTIYDIFRNKNFHHLIVIEDKELCGIISDRDLFKALSPFLNTAAEQNRDLNTLKKRAHQIMNRNLITITKDTTLETAVHHILQNNISCLPVISPDGQVEGIVTWKDLLRAYSYVSIS